MDDKIKEFFDFVRTIKGPQARSNAVLTPASLEAAMNERGAQIVIGQDAAVVLEPDTDNILRLQYYARSSEALSGIPDLVPPTQRRVVCDIVGREPKAGEQADELARAGFSFYAKFQRMFCKELCPDDTLDITDVEEARPEDAEEILEITYEAFDPLTARIMTREALIKRIEEGEVFLVRRDGCIAGFTSFDSNEKRVALLDHVIVRPEYREQKIAKKILTYKWKHKNCSDHYILWINALCTGPIRYHEKNGFEKDGMYDYILIMQKKEQ